MKQYEPFLKYIAIMGWALFFGAILILLTPENGSAPLMSVVSALPQAEALLGLLGLSTILASAIWLGVIAKRSELNIWIWGGVGAGLGLFSVWAFYHFRSLLMKQR